MEEIKSTILEILEEMHPDEDFEHCDTLVDSKVLDSFDIITLISEINEEFDVTISADKIVPENFNSAESIWKMIKRLQEN